MYKIIVESSVTVTEEVEVVTEYGDYYDSFIDEVDEVYLFKKLECTEEDNLVEYVDIDLHKKLQDTSLSKFLVKDNKFYINSEFVAIKRLTKEELERLRLCVSAQYSDGYYESCYNKGIFNGRKTKEYTLCPNWENVTVQQKRL